MVNRPPDVPLIDLDVGVTGPENLTQPTHLIMDVGTADDHSSGITHLIVKILEEPAALDLLERASLGVHVHGHCGVSYLKSPSDLCLSKMVFLHKLPDECSADGREHVFGNDLTGSLHEEYGKA